MIGVPSRLVPLAAAKFAKTGPHVAPGLAGSTVNQKYVMIHMPRMSSQKYPNGLLLAPFLARGLLLSLPSRALRLVANLQSCLSWGVATLVTGKQCGMPVPMVPQGVFAKVPSGSLCFTAA